MTEKKAIINGNILTGTGSAMPKDSVLLMEDDTITYVGQPVPLEGYDTIDAKGMTVMPGLIDAHIHFFGAMPPKPFRTYAPEVGLIKSIRDAEHLLQRGFTTVRECGGLNGLYIREAARCGLVERIPKIISAGHVVLPTNNGIDDPEQPVENFCYDTNRQKEFLLGDGVDACLHNARRAILKGGDFIKIFMTGNYAFAHCSDQVTLFTDEEVSAIVSVAEGANTYVAAHCMSDKACRQAIRCGVKSIEHAVGISRETAELAKESGVTLTSALAFARCEPQLNDAVWQRMVAGYQAAREAGVVLAIGSDMNSSPLFSFDNNANELVHLVEHCGFSPMEAICVGTKNGAIACRTEDRGTLEAGKKADILFVNGDPLSDISVLTKADAIRKVFVDGTLCVDKEH